VRTSEYGSLVLEGLRRILIEPGSQAANLARRGETGGGVRVERVYLDESGPEHEIAILSRDLIVGVTRGDRRLGREVQQLQLQAHRRGEICGDDY
jgi:hypothetical protein